MNDRRAQYEQRLKESLYDMYEQGGLELYLAGTSGLSDRQVNQKRIAKPPFKRK